MKFAGYEKFICLMTLAGLLAGCAGGAPSPNAGTGEGIYKVGNPYEVDGAWYYPRENYSYDETGVASWYGQAFHGDRTANGEIFNKNELTAAHRTLPLPTLARVTNLDNGRSIVVRINDRGPFARGRIIDVSQRAAQLLGFEQQGTAKVRVQVLADESKAIADAMRRYGRPAQLAENEGPGVVAAPRETVSAQELEPVSNTIDQPPKPVVTTPAVHQQLLETKPVEQVVQLPVTGANQLFVQAGAFTVRDNAVRMQQSLAKLGPASITEAVVNGKKFYRVRIGPITDVAHADMMLDKTVHAGVVKPRIIVD